MKRRTVIIISASVTAAVLAFDVWLALDGTPGNTISQTVWASKSVPLAFAAGFLCGHLFWKG